MVSTVDVVKQAYQLLALGDAKGYLSILDSEVVISQSEELPWGGRYYGIEEALNFMKTVASHVESQVTIQDFVCAGDKVCAIGYTEGIAINSKKAFRCNLVHVWTIREEKVFGLEVFIENDKMLSALSM